MNLFGSTATENPHPALCGVIRDWIGARHVVTNILLIERDRDVRDAIASVLRMHRWRVIAVADAADAVANLREEPVPDLILIDSPHIESVRDCLRDCAAAGVVLNHVPVIAMVTTDHAPAGNILTVLKKPFEIGPLLTLIRNVGDSR